MIVTPMLGSNSFPLMQCKEPYDNQFNNPFFFLSERHLLFLDSSAINFGMSSETNFTKRKTLPLSFSIGISGIVSNIPDCFLVGIVTHSAMNDSQHYSTNWTVYNFDIVFQ